MAFSEYEKIALSAGRSKPSAPTNLDVIEESEATGEVAALYQHFREHFGRPDVPGILKCFATHPPLLRHMMNLSESLIFAEGHLTRRHKEMIATLVSVENDCPYCADSHAFFFRVHDGSAEALRAIKECQLESASLTRPEQASLVFAQKVNRSSSEIRRPEIEILRNEGWNDAQVAEAIHVAALFSTFNRVANAFGLESQGLLALYANESSALT
ncbi:MAG TPA: peroxidase-related enzyme [Terracidiphilus sp.]|nr:peroxidase-related enzyme [Terracidiphilus sp.]